MAKDFIKKPLLTFLVIALVVALIVFIEYQKPDFVIDKRNENTQKTEYALAPDFAGIEKWINSEPLTINGLRGKVVLVDFWTYTCINCIRTLPYLKSWHDKYRDDGLVIVGIHTPEFEFEKKHENVLKAVTENNLKYPIAMDNNYVTWQLYQNRYWPHKYLIDIDGNIRYDHIGEGNYEETEKMIQKLLQERMERLNKKNGIKHDITKQNLSVDFSKIGTPEIYFGYQFDRGNLGYENIPADSIVDFKIPTEPFKNFVYLSGKWKYNKDNMELIDDEGTILLIFDAKNVNMVAGSEEVSDAVVFLDNDFENQLNKGNDVELSGNKSTAKIDEFKLYNVAKAEGYGNHVIQLDVFGKGFKIYTFTFG